MKKAIIENKVNNPRDTRELTMIYLLEKLTQLDEGINQEDIIAFFSNRFNEDLRPEIIKRLEIEIENTLQEITQHYFENKLMRMNYTFNDKQRKKGDIKNEFGQNKKDEKWWDTIWFKTISGQ